MFSALFHYFLNKTTYVQLFILMTVQWTNSYIYLIYLMRIFIRRIFTNRIFTYFLMNSINTLNSQNRFNLGQNILELATKTPPKTNHFLENEPKTYLLLEMPLNRFFLELRHFTYGRHFEICTWVRVFETFCS